MLRQTSIGNRRLIVMAMVALAILADGRSPLHAEGPTIAGSVKSPEGKPVAGALVQVKSEGLSFTVVSQAQGRYTTPNLRPGKYMVQAWGGDRQTVVTGPVDVIGANLGKMDLVLNSPLRIAESPKRLTDSDYEKMMPEAETKRIIATDCKECHSLEWTVSARKSRDQWQDVVERMYNNLLGRRTPLWFAMKDDEFAQGHLKRDFLDYLSKNFGPDIPLDPRVAAQALPFPGGPSHPNRNLPTTLLKGPAAKFFAMEFSLPSGSMPRDIAVDSQGIAWVTERNTGMLGRFDPNTLTYTRIACPKGKDPMVQLHAVAVDRQDNVWFADDGPNGRILKYDPKNEAFNAYVIPEYPFPVPDSGPFRIATIGFSNGNVWATRLTAQRLLKLDPITQKIDEYSVPRGSMPYGLSVGVDGKIRYSAEVGNEVVSLEPSTGKLTPHYVPTVRSDLRAMAADAEGNLWVAAMESGKLVRVDNQTGDVSEVDVPTKGSAPFAVDVDTKRNLVWFSEILSDKFGRYDPSSKSFVEFPQPSADADIRRIEVDRNHPNRVWWAGSLSNRIGYLEVIE